MWAGHPTVPPLPFNQSPIQILQPYYTDALQLGEADKTNNKTTIKQHPGLFYGDEGQIWEGYKT